MDFRWQLYKVAPLEQHTDNTAVLEAGLAEEVQGLGGTLFDEVAKSADDIWRRVYHGKTEVTHKALSPLRTLHVHSGRAGDTHHRFPQRLSAAMFMVQQS